MAWGDKWYKINGSNVITHERNRWWSGYTQLPATDQRVIDWEAAQAALQDSSIPGWYDNAAITLDEIVKADTALQTTLDGLDTSIRTGITSEATAARTRKGIS